MTSRKSLTITLLAGAAQLAIICAAVIGLRCIATQEHDRRVDDRQDECALHGIPAEQCARGLYR